MKIVIATPLYPPDIGGPATFTVMLEAELPVRGVETATVAFGDVRRLSPLLRHGVFLWRVLRASRGAGIILALDPLGVGLPTLVAAFLARKRFFVRVAGDRAWESHMSKNKGQKFRSFEEFQGKKFGGKTWLRRKVQTFVSRHAEKVIVPGAFLGSMIEGWGVLRERIEIVPNSFDAGGESEETKDDPRRAIGKGAEGKMIVGAGRLVPWKGFPSLVEATILARRAFPDTALTIVGEGPERSDIERRIAAAGAGEYIFLTGALPRTALFRLLRASDVCVLNTGYEGFSHQILEAMGLGVPVVASDIPANRELVEHGVNGLLFPYDDVAALASAIETVLGDAETANRLAAQGRMTAAHFTTRRAMTKLFETLRL